MVTLSLSRKSPLGNSLIFDHHEQYSLHVWPLSQIIGNSSATHYFVFPLSRFAGYLFKRVGKLTLSMIGGGILVLQVYKSTTYIPFTKAGDWMNRTAFLLTFCHSGQFTGQISNGFWLHHLRVHEQNCLNTELSDSHKRVVLCFNNIIIISVSLCVIFSIKFSYNTKKYLYCFLVTHETEDL